MAIPIPRRVRFHDLRHTAASLLLAAGADLLYAVARIPRHTARISAIVEWRALLDSNQWPSASETDALSN
jgi:integrase